MPSCSALWRGGLIPVCVSPFPGPHDDMYHFRQNAVAIVIDDHYHRAPSYSCVVQLWHHALSRARHISRILFGLAYVSPFSAIACQIHHNDPLVIFLACYRGRDTFRTQGTTTTLLKGDEKRCSHIQFGFQLVAALRGRLILSRLILCGG